MSPTECCKDSKDGGICQQYWRWGMPRSRSPLAKTDRNANIRHLLKREKSLLEWQHPAATQILGESSPYHLDSSGLSDCVKLKHHSSGGRGGVQKYHIFPPKAKWEAANLGWAATLVVEKNVEERCGKAAKKKANREHGKDWVSSSEKMGQELDRCL